MEKIVLPKIEVNIYKSVLSNGLCLYVIPKDKGESVYATFTSKYGSSVLEFVPSGQTDMVKVEAGIAHFLEHKVFEQKNREDPFSYFGKRGADVNASTSYEKTSYVFSGSTNILENINYLLDFVQDPYLTNENVEKEKGIIKEELLMYQDDPYTVLSEKSILNSFHTHLIRNPIGGSIENIMKITKEMLELCYQTFYHPSNMFLVVSGHVDPKEIEQIVIINQEKKKFKEIEKIKTKVYKEVDTVYKEEEVIIKNVVIPKVSVNFKINYTKVKKHSLFITRLALFMFFNSKFGTTSSFVEKLKKEQLINDTLNIDMISTDKHFLFLISGDTKKPNELIQKIKEEVKNIEIEADEIERKKKVLLSTSIYASDNIYALGSKVMSHVITYGDILDDYDLVKKFTNKDLESILSVTDFTNISTVVIDKAS